MSIEGWRREPGNESFFGLDRAEIPKKTMSTKDKLLWRWYRIRCWVATNILKVSVE